MTPEHAHLVLVHLPIVGVLAAVLPLLWGVLRRDRTATALGLALAAASALATPVVVATGDRAEERFEHGTGALALDPGGARWLELHEERAEAGAVVLYVAAAAFAVGLGVVLKKDSAALTRGVGVGALALSALSLATLTWVAEAGGKIRHPELRTEAPAALTAPSAAGSARVPTGDDD